MIDIYSIHYNKPEYISLQLESYKKYIKEDFSFTIIDNSIEYATSIEIFKYCMNNNLGYRKTYNNTPHNAAYYGWSHIYGLSFFKKELINSQKQFVALIEHDIFLCSSFNKISELMSKYSVCGYAQQRENIVYLHPGLMFFNKQKCPNIETIDFLGGYVNGVHVDVGGQTFSYINQEGVSVAYLDDTIVSGLEEITDKHIFYHMVDGSNWSGNSGSANDTKLKKINEILNKDKTDEKT